MTVYRIHTDLDRYQYLRTDDRKFYDRYRFDGESYVENWSPPEMYIYKPKKKIPDFWGTSTLSGFALSSELYEELPMLDPAGELLPAHVEGLRDLLLFNITNVINCLDKKKATVNRTLGRVKNYAFVPKRIDQSIFKIPETSIKEMFAVEGIASPEDEFKSVVESMGLKGLSFEEVWTGKA